MRFHSFVFIVLLSSCYSFTLFGQESTKKAVLNQLFTLSKNDTVWVNANFGFFFSYHSHKITMEGGPESPLICNFSYINNNATIEKNYYWYDGLPYVWRWKNYLFVVTDYSYDSSMKMKVILDENTSEK